MNMSNSGGLLSVPSEHLPGLVALILVPMAVVLGLLALRGLAGRGGVAWAQPAVARVDALSLGARAALFGTLVGGVVHAALVPTHWADDRTVALLFIADAVGFAVAFVWVLLARRAWLWLAVAMLAGTTGVYMWYLVTGRESADLVGVLTTTIELATALIALSSVLDDTRHAAWVKGPWLIAAPACVAVVALIGTSAIAGASSTTESADTSGSSATSHAMPGMALPATSSRPLSLATTSPAGPIVWPDDMSTMAPGMRMATPDCTAAPTAQQQHAAVDLVDQTVAAAAPYRSLAAAKAAGYIPITRSGRRVVHYINPAIYRQGATLDPSKLPVLVYVNTPHGAVLSAGMYLMPRRSAASPPQPGGCLTQWHIHTDLCFSGAGVVGNDDGGSCAAGSSNRTTMPMMHVWLTPVAGGPLAPDPPAASEVAAANQLPPLQPVNGIA